MQELASVSMGVVSVGANTVKKLMHWMFELQV